MSASHRHSWPDLLRAARRADPTPGAALLARFVAARDEAAFAALVERHGPLVLGVCRRVLGDAHAAAGNRFVLMAWKKSGRVWSWSADQD
jgi:hypothetical protein